MVLTTTSYAPAMQNYAKNTQGPRDKYRCGPDTLRAWVRRTETDSGRRYGITTAERGRIKALPRYFTTLINTVFSISGPFLG